jgi:predicted site-specific integrase-resolvase
MKENLKKLLLEKLKTTPIIQAVCSQTGISRATYYRWIKDEKFKEKVDKAIYEGIELINDVAEGQLLAEIKNRNLSATTYWLKNRHPSYASKVDINNHIIRDLPLSPEEDQLLDEVVKKMTEETKSKDEK